MKGLAEALKYRRSRPQEKLQRPGRFKVDRRQNAVVKGAFRGYFCRFFVHARTLSWGNFSYVKHDILKKQMNDSVFNMTYLVVAAIV